MDKYDKFINDIDNYANITNISGYLFYTDRNKTYEKQYNLKETFFPVSLLSFCINIVKKLIDNKMLSVTDKISDYLNISFGLNKTIEDILNNESDFPCYENIAIEKVKDNYKDYYLSNDRFILETQVINRNLSLADLNFSQYDLSNKRNNKTNMLVLKYIIEKVLNKSLYDVCLEYVLENVNYKLLDNINLYGRFNVGKDILIPFSDLIASDYIFVNPEELLSLCKKMEVKDLITLSVCDFRYYEDDDLSYVVALTNRGSALKVGGHYHGFTYFLEKEVRALNIYPSKPKLVLVNQKNYCDVMEFETEDYQKEFICDSRNSLCYAFFSKYRKAYALVDHNVTIGLTVLDFDKRNNIYDISILQIDKVYQNKGYGKILLEKVLSKIYKIAKGKGTITIGVKRDNQVAYKLYKSFGFIEKSVNPGFILLEKIINGEIYEKEILR